MSAASARRPRPGLTPALVVAAGRALIERDGLDALTMRAVAAELDTAATSLYRHVADRDALLLAILEQMAEELPVEVPGRTPRRRLLNRMVAAHDYFEQHVWVLHVLIRGELVAENAFPFTEACLADFIDGGLTPRRALTAYRACWHLILGDILQAHSLGEPRRITQRSRALDAVDHDLYPATAATRRYDVGAHPESFAVTIGAVVEAFLT